ncbi:Thiamin pyrophosphokinase, catalytic domain [Roseovarius albus]|uniref:Thiamine diphosphokinase n=1 Tax=Roseovarius albus TaxID=1247867 RepID=A0A1X6Z6J6_9RHOB|nr:thiamine diphosphokinase [Roseovarius albus]SLN40237.1 Thiamin pyrophosphokinase, catalytic domain [Roseovarius albus]
MIVDILNPITLIGGANISEGDLERALTIAPDLAAADGGANYVVNKGLKPLAVIGDFDSISENTKKKLPDSVLFPIEEQDSTDFEKCLRNIAAPLMLAVGFSGDRQDHQLAAYNALVRFPQQRCVLIGLNELVFLCPPSLSLDLPARCPVSLFPMGAVEGMSDGLEWPINGLNFAPDGRIGTSNRATGPVQLDMTAPKMLVILPQDALEIVATALIDTTAAWG